MPSLPNTQRLLEIMARLRDPDDGCVWDVEQTFATIAPHTIEEAYEVADAIDQSDMAALKDELGDLLLQVVFHSQMASEEEHFDFEDVAEIICQKMVRRHPHVFGDVKMNTTKAQTRAWEAQKAEERRHKAKQNGEDRHGALDGVIAGLPALTRALKLQKRAARVGFDWDEAVQVLDKIREEVSEVAHEVENDGDGERLEDEIGDLLFACVNLARKLDVNPETALRRGNGKFERRFRRIEALLAETGRTPEASSLDEMEEMWNQAKHEERAISGPADFKRRKDG